MADKKGSIFISYRRQNINEARLLHTKLEGRGYDAFLDLESMRNGKFNVELLRQIESRDNFVLMLYPGSLDRCTNKGDWVYREIAHALKNNINVVPVMSRDFKFPNKLLDDIDAIRFMNAVLMDDIYYDPFVDKLETFLVAAESSDATHRDMESETNTVSNDKKEQLKKSEISRKGKTEQKKSKISLVQLLKTGKKWIRCIIAILCVAALCLLGWYLYNNRDIAEADTSVSASYGNTAGNLCNVGLGTPDGSTSPTSKNVSYINRLDSLVYWYNPSRKSIYIKEIEKEANVLKEIRDVGYLLVTENWFYYTVEDGNTALYRVPRLEEGTSMGESEVLLTGFSDDNNMIIEDNYVYYWKEGKGLYSYGIVKGKEKSLFETESTWNYDLIGKFDNWIYVYDTESIWRIDIKSGKQETLFAVADLFADTEIRGGNVYGSWLYVTLKDLKQDMIDHADRVYRMHPDGSQMNRVFVAESINHDIDAINIYGEERLYVSISSGNESCSYKVDLKSGDILGQEPDSFSGFTQRFEVDEGNSITNLCNNAFVVRPEDFTSYLGDETKSLYNKYSEEIGIYYVAKENKIILNWSEGEKSYYEDLLTGVDCTYLYATPDWIYYALQENGTTNLYRAENKFEEHTIGAPKLLASNITVENNIAIYNGWIYYWVAEEGLYRVRCDGRDAQLFDAVSDGGNCLGWKTFHITDDYLYFYVTRSLYKVSLDEENKRYYFFNGTDCFADGKIASVVMYGGDTALIVRYLKDGERIRGDELWLIDGDGEAKNIYTMSSVENEMLVVNVTSSNYYLKVKEQGVEDILYFSLNGERMD